MNTNGIAQALKKYTISVSYAFEGEDSYMAHNQSLNGLAYELTVCGYNVKEVANNLKVGFWTLINDGVGDYVLFDNLRGSN